MRTIWGTSALLRWFTYGYVLGFLGWLTLAAIFLAHDWHAGCDTAWAIDYVLRTGMIGFFWAFPWAFANGVCGMASGNGRSRLTALAASIGIVAGIAYNFSGVYTFGGWLAITIPFTSIPLMLGTVAIVMIGHWLFRAAHPHV